MFGRATIRLGIGPHSSFVFVFVFDRLLTFCLFDGVRRLQLVAEKQVPRT